MPDHEWNELPFFGELQKDEALYSVHRLINVPPMREAALREVVGRPAALLSARFEKEWLPDDIARDAAEASVREAGALPLLSYHLDDMWKNMIQRGDGVLRRPSLADVLVERAGLFISKHPDSEGQLRRIFTLKLATVREDGQANRRQAYRSEFSNEEWRLVRELADDPNRLLVTVTPETGETYAEVAYETIFHRWDKLRDWIVEEREFLIWKASLEAAWRTWRAAPANSKSDVLLVGFPLVQAHRWLTLRAQDIPTAGREFIVLSRRMAQRRKLRVKALVAGRAFLIAMGLVARWQEAWLRERYFWFVMRGYVLSEAQARALKPGQSFLECAEREQDYSARYCPLMVVLPAGKFVMGSWQSGDDVHGPHDEEPPHNVLISSPFAVSKYEVTFDQWDACVDTGGCKPPGGEVSTWGRGRQPAIDVNWEDAQQYVKWLSKLTGRNYRLLSEAEWEYAASALDLEELDRRAWYSENSNNQAHPVGEKAPNAFGLHDMHGNVAEWVEDCYHDSYIEAPTDGWPWVNEADCVNRVIRGGSWREPYNRLYSTSRAWNSTDSRKSTLGFRVARTLTDVKIGTEIAVLRGHASWVDSAAFSPDGKRVVSRPSRNGARHQASRLSDRRFAPFSCQVRPVQCRRCTIRPCHHCDHCRMKGRAVGLITDTEGRAQARWKQREANAMKEKTANRIACNDYFAGPPQFVHCIALFISAMLTLWLIHRRRSNNGLDLFRGLAKLPPILLHHQ